MKKALVLILSVVFLIVIIFSVSSLSKHEEQMKDQEDPDHEFDWDACKEYCKDQLELTGPACDQFCRNELAKWQEIQKKYHRADEDRDTGTTTKSNCCCWIGVTNTGCISYDEEHCKGRMADNPWMDDWIGYNWMSVDDCRKLGWSRKLGGKNTEDPNGP